ncbi:hypothetical protein H1R20_g14258, partial [Candolleomyces eurysporus]
MSIEEDPAAREKADENPKFKVSKLHDLPITGHLRKSPVSDSETPAIQIVLELGR